MEEHTAIVTIKFSMHGYEKITVCCKNCDDFSDIDFEKKVMKFFKECEHNAMINYYEECENIEKIYNEKIVENQEKMILSKLIQKYGTEI